MAEFAKLDGLEKTVAALRALPAELASKNGGPIRRALYAGAKVMRDDAQSRAPVDTGNLKANVFIYRDRDPQRSGATERYLIGVRTKRGHRARIARSRLNTRLGRVGARFRLKGDAYYWHFVEFGTQKSKAQPFLRPAFESHKSETVSTFSAKLARDVEAAVRKVAAK